MQECIDAGLVLEYKKGEYLWHCPPCFLVAKPACLPVTGTAGRLTIKVATFLRHT